MRTVTVTTATCEIDLGVCPFMSSLQIGEKVFCCSGHHDRDGECRSDIDGRKVRWSAPGRGTPEPEVEFSIGFA